VSDAPRSYRITLVRHGESAGNAGSIYQGQHDYPLTDTGLLQARLLGERWQAEGLQFDRILSSPLARAHQTARVIAESIPAEIVLDSNWMERDFGRLSGLTAAEAAEKEPRPAFIGLYDPVASTGESQWELYLRAGRAVQDLLLRPPGSYLVVSHGGILNMAMHAILGITPTPNFQGPHFYFRNTSFARFNYRPEEHNWQLLSFNDQQHWETHLGGIQTP
jgi:2,3-bisphosphoglycerate-dependent phosphoglycerate mutase